MLRLRGHHLFCLALFSGHGYDEAFTRRMTEVSEAVAAGGSFRLCVGADGVCSACPNRTEASGCALGTEDVLQRDREALAVLGLDADRSLRWEEALSLLRCVQEGDFQRVCGGCRWQRAGLCSCALLRERASRSCVSSA